MFWQPFFHFYTLNSTVKQTIWSMRGKGDHIHMQFTLRNEGRYICGVSSGSRNDNMEAAAIADTHTTGASIREVQYRELSNTNSTTLFNSSDYPFFLVIHFSLFSSAAPSCIITFQFIIMSQLYVTEREQDKQTCWLIFVILYMIVHKCDLFLNIYHWCWTDSDVQDRCWWISKCKVVCIICVICVIMFHFCVI